MKAFLWGMVVVGAVVIAVACFNSGQVATAGQAAQITAVQTTNTGGEVLVAETIGAVTFNQTGPNNTAGPISNTPAIMAATANIDNVDTANYILPHVVVTTTTVTGDNINHELVQSGVVLVDSANTGHRGTLLGAERGGIAFG